MVDTTEIEAEAEVIVVEEDAARTTSMKEDVDRITITKEDEARIIKTREDDRISPIEAEVEILMDNEDEEEVSIEAVILKPTIDKGLIKQISSAILVTNSGITVMSVQ